MRILFRAHPQYGHVYPMMPLAYAARAAGHDVIFPIAGPFADRIAALGFGTVAAGIRLEDAVERRFGGRRPQLVVDGETRWESIGEFFAEAATAVAADLYRLLPELEPDLVIYESTDVGAGAAAAADGIPAIEVGIVRSLEPAIERRMFGVQLAELDDRFGAVPRPAMLLDAYPPSLQRPAFLADPRRLPLRPVPWAEPTLPLPSSVGASDRTQVFVSVGSVAASAESGRIVVEGLADLDADIVLATGISDASGLVVPDNVHVVPFVHQAGLLPHLDLMIHHGGCGTTTSAWTHGIAQLVLPDGADRFVNADAVAQSGSGIALREPTADLVAKSVRMLLDDPAYRRRAAGVRDEIAAMPSPADVIAAITS